MFPRIVLCFGFSLVHVAVPLIHIITYLIEFSEIVSQKCELDVDFKRFLFHFCTKDVQQPHCRSKLMSSGTVKPKGLNRRISGTPDLFIIIPQGVEPEMLGGRCKKMKNRKTKKKTEFKKLSSIFKRLQNRIPNPNKNAKKHRVFFKAK